MAMMHPNFEQRLVKAHFAEMLVQKVFEAHGWVRYAPTTPGAHAFDGLFIKDKRDAFAFDVKAKARLNSQSATGVDVGSLAVYEEFSKKHNIPFCLFFVDEHLGTIYGNSIKQLEREHKAKDGIYPYTADWKKKTRIYSLEQMILFAEIDPELCSVQARNSQRNHHYSPTTETHYSRNAKQFCRLVAQQSQ